MNEVKNEVPLNLEDALKEERSLVKICVNLRNLWTSLK